MLLQRSAIDQNRQKSRGRDRDEWICVYVFGDVSVQVEMVPAVKPGRIDPRHEVNQVSTGIAVQARDPESGAGPG